MTKVRVNPASAQASADAPRVRPPGLPRPPKTGYTEPDPQVQTLKDYTSSKAVADPFKQVYSDNLAGGLSIIEPTYSPYALLRMPQENSMLYQCIAAMVTNVHGHGYDWEYVGPEGQADSRASKDEKLALSGLFQFPNDEYSFSELRDRLGKDHETLGDSYMEIGRDRQRRVVMLSHLPAHTMRLTTRDRVTVPVKVNLPRFGGPLEQTVQRSFRRFVQIVGSRRIYFKEYGDPRSISSVTGAEDTSLAFEDSATEVIHMNQYTPGSPYGLPRWFNQLPSVMGMRQAEMTNLDFFTDNAIPAMAVMVSGGMITEESLREIESHITAARGRKSMNRIMVIEAEGDPAAATEAGAVPVPRITMQPLASDRQKEGMFALYEKDGADKIRSSFRLPPLFIGLSADLTYATAKTAYEIAEAQVFKPERGTFDDNINHKILTTHKPVYWKFKSNQPTLSDGSEILQALEAFDGVGALTPNVAINLANQYFGTELKTVTEDWGNYPFPLVMAAFTAARLKVEGLENSVPPAPPAPLAPPAPGGSVSKVKPGKPDKAFPADTATPVGAASKSKPKAKPATKLERLSAVVEAISAMRGDMQPDLFERRQGGDDHL